MRSSEFKKSSTKGNLQSLVKQVIRAKPLTEIVKTPLGNVYRIIAGVNLENKENIWYKISSPLKIAKAIPGLSHFSLSKESLGGLIEENHFMFFCYNYYKGRIFCYNSQIKVWGMTNHPVKDENLFDIPHNVVYHYNKSINRVSVGIDYVPAGYLGDLKITRPAARILAKLSMIFALVSVKRYLMLKNDRLIEK